MREGEAGDHGDGAFSTGRGGMFLSPSFPCLPSRTRPDDPQGAANIGSPGLQASQRKDTESIPELAIRQSSEDNFHAGRGGEGNAHHAGSAGPSTLGPKHPEGLADKLKNKLFKSKAAKNEEKGNTA